MEELSKQRALSSMKMLMFTCWFMDGNIDILRLNLPRKFTLIHWDYNKSAGRRKFLERRLRIWSELAKDFQLWFMPPGTLSLNPGHTPRYYESPKLIDSSFYDIREDLGAEVTTMLRVAKKHGIENTVFFLGWTWESASIRGSLVEGLNRVYRRDH
jgi:hypothetical protein